MTYYLGKVGRAGVRLMSSCKDLYNDVNAAYLTGATDVIVVKQKDGTLKSTPFHVRFGKLGVLRTGDLKEVEIEVNGRPVGLTMNIDETGKVFFCRTKRPEGSQSSDSDREQVVIEMESGASLQPLASPKVSDASSLGVSPRKYRLSSIERTKSESLERHTHELEPPSRLSTRSSAPVVQMSTSDSPSLDPTISPSVPISISPHSSPTRAKGLLSTSMPDRLGVLSDTMRVSEDEDEDSDLNLALSDSEVVLKDRRMATAMYWKESTDSMKATVGEVTPSAAQTNIPEDERYKPHKDQAAESSSSNVDRPGFWGALTGMLKMRQYKRMESLEDGMYLDDIDSETMDPVELSKFFPSNVPALDVAGPSGIDASGMDGNFNFTCSSGVGSSPAHSLSPCPSVTDLHQPVRNQMKELVDTLSGISFSLCGGLSLGIVTEEVFQSSLVPFPEFCANPLAILSNPDLVVKVKDKFYRWQVASPLIMSAIVYLQVLPQISKDKIMKDTLPKKSRQSFWSFWGRGQKEDMEAERAKSVGASPSSSPRKWKEEVRPERRREDSESGLKESGDEVVGGPRGDKEDDLGVQPLRDSEGLFSSDEDAYVVRSPVRPRQRSLKRKKIGFTNNLTSEQLESLSLEPGPNKVQFSITTKYQGTAKATCTVYLWNYYDKIVVSDIDGTITRSDVAGQVLPLLGMDWTQNGVVELFSAISKNGYKIAYLSARAIGQAGYTKEFLRKLRRGSSCLPDGPLFLFPFSLYKAFRKEVIERRPEEFKIDCLKQIRAIFPEEFSPLHAGFGNKHNDVKSYTNVGIPESRIFTVNHKGILRHELSVTFQSSYMYLVQLVDRQFPPLKQRKVLLHMKHSDSICENEEMKEEYNTFNFWRTPLESVDLPDLS